MQKTKTKMSHSRAKAAKGEPRKKWQLQMAKARFSELFRCARSEGPQLITRQGKEGVVMISEEQYDQLVGRSYQPKSLVRFFRESPLGGVELDLERAKDDVRTDL